MLDELGRGAEEHIAAARPKKTTASYAGDWKLWPEFRGWLAERTGTPLALTAVTKGTMAGRHGVAGRGEGGRPQLD
ncbi:hypothetical protein [Streptomyces sp. NPDC048349]|uniref:hypothetical protein n=1 Tax=Streptomyces sp. NPDC048349 TaxID=3155486 RepID=UPI00343A057E